MELIYLTHKEIDFAKWDATLQQCSNKLIYAESIYLNTMCGEWDAIVNKDWTAIMPIPIKKKYGIKYSPTVTYIQQLGVFTVVHTSKLHLELFYNLLIKTIKLGQCYWNYTNIFEKSVGKKNFILHLNKEHEVIQKNYKSDLKYDLRRNIHFSINHSFSIQLMLEMLQKEYQHRFPHVTKKNFLNLEVLTKFYLKKDRAICKAIIQNNEVLSAFILLKDDARIYNIASVITEKGKKQFANHFLYDAILKEYANTHYIFDFEGSDVDGIAHFYEKFGAHNQPYSCTEFNNLPKWIKVFSTK